MVIIVEVQGAVHQPPETDAGHWQEYIMGVLFLKRLKHVYSLLCRFPPRPASTGWYYTGLVLGQNRLSGVELSSSRGIQVRFWRSHDDRRFSCPSCDDRAQSQVQFRESFVLYKSEKFYNVQVRTIRGKERYNSYVLFLSASGTIKLRTQLIIMYGVWAAL